MIVKYIDSQKAGLKEYPLVAKVTQMGYGFPIVAVNGEPRLAGAVDIGQIKEIISETIGEK
ncbi:MAG: hypothetical protein ACM3QW_09850 [Ignavibacteriales bacterium]